MLSRDKFAAENFPQYRATVEEIRLTSELLQAKLTPEERQRLEATVLVAGDVPGRTRV